MVFIKTTYTVEFKETKKVIRKVQCPYCNIYLETIPEYVTSMICWNNDCNKEFRIEKDHNKHIQHRPGIVTQIISRGVIE